MSVSWRELSWRAGLRDDGNTIRVQFKDARRQVVEVDAADPESIRLWSVAARPAALERLDEPLLVAWHRNRFTELVGFTLDARGRMVGETWVPTAGLTADEWQYYVVNLARACDRFEYLLTGSDEE
jgi:hypothetical protein